MAISPEIQKLLIEQPIDLPVFHPVALKLTLLIPDPFSDFDDIVRVISEDQALCAQVLKVANSSGYMGLAKAETIKDAAVRLGIGLISALAVGSSQASLHSSQNPTINALMQELWGHSFACAIGCCWVARTIGCHSIIDHAYLVGLLHDIGKLYLLKAVERIAEQEKLPELLEREQILEIFAQMHVAQGCRVVRHWNIPTIYNSAFEHHHDEKYDPADTLLVILRLVNALSRNISLSLDAVPMQITTRTPEMETLGLDPVQCAELESVMANYREVSLL